MCNVDVHSNMQIGLIQHSQHCSHAPHTDLARRTASRCWLPNQQPAVTGNGTLSPLGQLYSSFTGPRLVAPPPIAPTTTTTTIPPCRTSQAGGARQKIGDRCMRLWIIEKGSVICRQAQERSSDEQLWKTYLTGLLSTNGMLSARSLPWLIPKLVEQWNLQHQWVKDGSYLRNGSQSVLVYRNMSLPIDDIQVGEECYDAVQWAMTSGIVTNPESWPKWSVCSFACHFFLTCLLVSSLVDRHLPCLIDFYPPFSLSMLIEWNRTHLKIPRIW